MLARYFNRVKGHLGTAAMLSFWFLFIAFANILAGFMLSYLLVIGVSAMVLSTQTNVLNALRNTSPFIQAFIFVAILGLTLSVFSLSFPHVFLFVNAFPFPYLIALISLSNFIITFEFIVRVDHRNLGADYSLINLLLFSSARERLYEILMVPHQDPSEVQQNIIARQQANVQAKDKLELKPDLKTALIARQKTAVAKLPPEAIIDDIALYKKHKGNRDTTSAEAKTLEEAYKKTLQSDAQRETYTTYREIARTLSPIYATCSISLENIPDDLDASKFIIMEKRYLQTNLKSTLAVPGSARIYDKESFLCWLAAKGTEPDVGDSWTAPDSYPNPIIPGGTRQRGKHPVERYDREKGPSYDTNYCYHQHELVSGHGLSMQLCDAIDEFLDPTLVAKRRPLLQQKVKSKKMTPPTDYHKAPTANNALLSQNMYNTGPNATQQRARDEELARSLDRMSDEQVAAYFSNNR